MPYSGQPDSMFKSSCFGVLPPSSPSYQKSSSQGCTFQIQTNRSRAYIPNHLTYWAVTIRPLTAVITAGSRTRQQGPPLCLWACWNYSNEAILILLTLPHPSLSTETTIKVSAHNLSLSLCLMPDPGASLCAPLPHGVVWLAPSSWELWVIKSLFNVQLSPDLLALLYLKFSINILYFKWLDYFYT